MKQEMGVYKILQPLLINIMLGTSSNGLPDRNMHHLSNKGQRAESRALKHFDLWTLKHSAD